MENPKCPKCGEAMKKGLFVPDVGTIGMKWTNKLEFSKWKFEKIKKTKTFQFACIKCGYIESFLDLSESEK